MVFIWDNKTLKKQTYGSNSPKFIYYIDWFRRVSVNNLKKKYKQQKLHVICIFQIYTDWANHYLEKARNKRFISDLQQDVSDGVLLADVIEAVSMYYLNTICLSFCV